VTALSSGSTAAITATPSPAANRPSMTGSCAWPAKPIGAMAPLGYSFSSITRSAKAVGRWATHALSAHSIDIDLAPKSVSTGQPPNLSVAAALIARLAIDLRFQSRGLGEALVPWPGRMGLRSHHSPPDRRHLFDADIIAHLGPGRGGFRRHQRRGQRRLCLPLTLADHLGLRELIDDSVDLGDAAGHAHVGLKAMGLIASVLAGGDSIADADVLRSGRSEVAIGQWMPVPSTLGTCLGAPPGPILVAWIPSPPSCWPGRDSTICQVYGVKKQGGTRSIDRQPAIMSTSPPPAHHPHQPQPRPACAAST
jgi:hypothetical protein